MLRHASLAIAFLMLTACSGEGADPEVAATVEEPKVRNTVLFDAAVPTSLQTVFDHPEKVWLYTLLDRREAYGKLGIELPPDAESLQGWYVYDKVALALEEARKLLDLFREAVEYGSHGGVACFMPHHALHIESEGRTLDILVCFLCKNFYVFPEGGRNNIGLDMHHGFEQAVREAVSRHRLRDVSEKKAK